MNPLLLSAIVGWLAIEVFTVARGVKSSGTPDKFNLAYYLSNNMWGIAFNALGTTLLYMSSGAVMLFERYVMAKYITDDPLLQEQLTDALLIPITGGLIGLFGALLVRWLIGKFEAKAKATSDQ